ncbi:MAG: efflux RND transporter permease subunit [Salinarimonadaceae bacterium]|nr:MAG: efflux RND transporter permease subunit [Salinarimonadaceae bacterium]
MAIIGANDGGLPALCVRRPVLAAVMSMLIVIAGLAAYLGVQVRELPNVDRPIITVRTAFPGATPDAIDTQVTSAIEGAVARVPGLVSLSSSSRRGTSQVTAEFSDSIDMNAAASDVREAVSGVRRRLPTDAEEPIIVKADSDGEAMMRLSLISDALPIDELTALAERQVVDRIAAVEGVADVQVWGARRPTFQVVVDPAALASRSLAVNDVQTALRSILVDQPAGTFQSGEQTLLVEAAASVRTVEEIAATFVNPRTRIGDVAEVRLAPADRSTILRADGESGISLGILRQAQSNTIAISDGVRAAVDDLRRVLPDGVELRISSDEAVFIRGAVKEVVTTLFIATGLVILIILIFFRSLRATFIPTITVPVALIGTLAAIWAMGFSINVLTLLALVLATGIVVDDAIVVLENIERRRKQGLGPRAAAVLGAREVFFAVIATTVTLVAVFVPISFLPGTAGKLFSEFGYVLAASVMLSSFVALTLVPMLASRMLKDGAVDAQTAERRARFDILGRFGSVVVGVYARLLSGALRAPLVVLTVAAVFALASFLAFRTLPEELTPPEDRGFVLLFVSAPQGSSLDYTSRKVQEIEDRIRPIVTRGDAESLLAIVGLGGRTNSAFLIMPLVDWSERELSQAQIVAEARRAISGVVGVQAVIRMPNSLRIRGAGQGLQFAVRGTDYGQITAAAEQLVRDIQDRVPGLLNPSLSFDVTQPQLSVRINRDLAADLGLSTENVSLALQTMLDGRRIGDISVNDRSIEVQMRGPADAIRNPSDLESLFIRASDNRLVPLSSVVELEEAAVAPSLQREGQMRAVPVNSPLADGYDLRRAMADIEALAAETLPPGTNIQFLGEAAALDQTSRGLAITFAFALLIVLLVLAAQFESFTSAVVIMVTVPFGIGAALLSMAIAGTSINIYSQIGLVILIGLMAKNGILIVEFANQLRDRGASVMDAVREASIVRFRPVMMTLLSTALGGVPLILSTGAGAEARQALGFVVVGGLILSVLFTLFLTPVTFSLLARFSKPRAAETQRVERELEQAARLEREFAEETATAQARSRPAPAE